MAENPIELLQMADEAIPEGTGYRGNKRKKQQRIRWAIIRVRRRLLGLAQAST